MTEGLSKLLDSFQKLAPLPLLAIGIGTGAVIFVPASMAQQLGIDVFRSSNRGWLGAIFVISCAYLLAHLICSAQRSLLAGWRKKRALRLLHDRLRELTPLEKGYLQPYLDSGSPTQRFEMDDGVAGGLEFKGIIFRATNMGDILTGFDFNIQPRALAHLQEHPELLEGAMPKPPPRSPFF